MPDNKRILILFAHPALEKSRVNVRLLRGVRDLNGVTVNDLYQHYPHFLIDVQREHELLEAHDIIVFQHPFYWYSAPALLKEWQDLVLEYGYAYGNDGGALNGKRLINVITVGGAESSYCQQGTNHYTMQELLQPFEQTARFCGMHYLPPFVVHDTLNMRGDGDVLPHVEDYQQLLIALHEDRLPYQSAAGLHRVNANLPELLGSGYAR